MADENKGNVPEVYVGGGKKKRRFSLKRSGKSNGPKFKNAATIIIAFLILVGIAVAVAVAVDQYRKHQVASKCQTDSTKASTLTNASVYIGTSDQKNLGTLVNQMKTFCNYDKDPNYQYVTANYYFMASDYDNAKKSYDKMMAVYNPQTGFDRSLTAGQKSIENLKSKIDILGNLTKVQ